MKDDDDSVADPDYRPEDEMEQEEVSGDDNEMMKGTLKMTKGTMKRPFIVIRLHPRLLCQQHRKKSNLRNLENH